MTRANVEVVAQSVTDARTAVAAGADRLEVCIALGVGGLTPPIGLVEAVLDTVAVPAHVLIRPRAGGFVYDADEADVCVRDIRAVLGAGAAGVVIGALTPSRTLDRRAIGAMVDAAREARPAATVTIHRAFDVVVEPLRALDDLRAENVDRLLTSGGAARVADGLPRIGELVTHAPEIAVTAGGGLRPADVDPAIRAGAAAVHLSARAVRHDPAPAGPGGGDGLVDAVDSELVREVVVARDGTG